MRMSSSDSSSAEMYVKAALGKKTIGLMVLDVRGIVSYTDMMMICSGRSNRQVTAIAEHIEAELKAGGKRPLGTEGIKEGRWALLDYGDMIIHVFYESVRDFYNLEGLLSDAKKIDISKFRASEDHSSEDDDDRDDED